MSFKSTFPYICAMTRKIIAALLFLAIPMLAAAQRQGQGHKSARITQEDGLSNSAVNCIFQDSEGRMWFGTWDGLNMYDGRHFKVFKPSPQDEGTLSNGVIRSITEQSEDVFWIATDKGVNRLRLNTLDFDCWLENLDLTGEKAYSVAIDPDGDVFVLVDGYGCYKYYKDKDDFRLLFAYQECTDAFFDYQHALWIHSGNGKLERYTFNSSDELSSSTIVDMNVAKVCPDKEGRRVAINYKDGNTAVLDIEKHIIEKTFNSTHVNAMAFLGDKLLYADEEAVYEYNIALKESEKLTEEERVMSLYPGSQGILWVGTDMRGVVKMVDVRNSDFSVFPIEGNSIFGDVAIRAICRSSNGNFLVGTKGKGIYEIASKDKPVYRHITSSEGLIDNSVYSIVQEEDGPVWIGTDGAGLNCLLNGRLSKMDMGGAEDVVSVYSILPWDKNTLFVGTAGNGLFMLIHNGLRVVSWCRIVEGIVYSVLRDDDRLIIGTRGRGVWEYVVGSGSLRLMSKELSNLDILSMHLDKKDRLWLGTGTGLYAVNSDGSGPYPLIRLSEGENLPNNTIHAILEDSEACLWVSTNNGIGRISETEGEFKIASYYTVDGLFGNEFCDGAACSTNMGHSFIFGNIGGMTHFDPVKISNSSHVPHLVLESFRIDNEDALLGEGPLLLPRGTNYVSFNFTPIDYLNGHRCKISYSTDEVNWVDIGTSGTVVLSRLKPGKYTLYVRASTPEAEWGEPEFIQTMRVRSVWYLSPLAKLFYVLLVLGLVCLLLWFILQRARAHDEITRRETVHEAKLKFFTDIAHEFSNSLTLIYGPCVQILSNPSIDSNTKRYATLIANSSERMSTLIQELIDFRKAESGHLKIHCNDVDLRELCHREMDYFSEMLAERRVSCRSELSEDIASWKTDRDSLEKMVFNLLSNAAKYTPSGEKIILSMREDKEKLHICVTNYGVGIDMDKIDSIFNRFTVLDRYEKDVSRGRRTTSNGIGLAMCKNLAELLGGSISVDSDGSTYVRFEIVLPQMNEEVEDADGLNTPSWRPAQVRELQEKTVFKEYEEPETFRGKLMLVVDDELPIRQFISELFASEFLIVQAENGKAALEEVRKRRPDIIISDVIMPEMNGVELLKVLKNNDLTRRIPVILLSSKDTVENQIEGLTEGADSFIGKPFNPKKLVALVNSTLKRDKAIIEYSNSSLSAVDMFEGKVMKNSVRELLTSVAEAVNRNLNNENLTLEMVAEEVAVSKMKLYRAIKETLEMTPTQYIRTIRIQHAEKLLRTTNMTVQEIIYACGFSSKAYFYKVFAERYGKTPKDYRNAN